MSSLLQHQYLSFRTLVVRECYRFMRLSRQTVFPPLLSTLLFILIFGYSLGSRIREIEGFPYILYILPGLASMGTITNSYANSSTSLFMARMDYSLENMVAAPLSNFQLVASLVLGGLLRGLIVGILPLLVSLLMVNLPIHSWFQIFLVLSLTSVFFSCLGIISALWSEGWDNIATFTNFVITPFVYLGGVFYSIHMLPSFWQKVSLANPIFYLVDAMRFAVLGVSDMPYALSLGLLAALALVSYLICVFLFRRGYKIMK